MPEPGQAPQKIAVPHRTTSRLGWHGALEWHLLFYTFESFFNLLLIHRDPSHAGRKRPITAIAPSNTDPNAAGRLWVNFKGRWWQQDLHLWVLQCHGISWDPLLGFQKTVRKKSIEILYLNGTMAAPPPSSQATVAQPPKRAVGTGCKIMMG